MRKILLSLIFAGLTAVSFGQVTNYSVGDVVDNFTVTDTEGNTHTLYDITASGKYVMLDFFFDTCPPCQSTTPLFNEVHDKYGCNDGDLYCISINNGTDSDAEVDAFEATYGGSFNHAPAVSADGGGGTVTTNFGVGAFPTYCMVGPDNKLAVADIWPVGSVADFENGFPSAFNPTVMSCSTAGLPELNISELTVFPNPANVDLNISFESEAVSTASIEVVNLLGEVIISENMETVAGVNQQMINVAELSTGVYFARISMNQEVATVKFTKR